MLNLGVIGGRRGSVLSEHISILDHPVRISAIADISDKILQEWKEKVPNVSLCADERGLLDDPVIDAVYIATPINFHIQHSINALNAGKHVLCEVPACTTIDEGLELINTVQRTGLIYMMAENYCFIPEHVFIKELCNQEEFGEVVYVTSSYIHDCKELFFSESGGLTWRGKMKRNLGGSDYPTHSVGPMAQWLKINKPDGDRFKRITTFGSRQAALPNYVVKRFGKDHPYAAEKYFSRSDGTFTIIETEKGVIIELLYDIYSNRPHSKAGCSLQGTKGSYISGRYDGEEGIIWLDSFNQKENRKYVTLSSLQKNSDNELNKQVEQLGNRYAKYMMMNEFIESIIKKRRPEINVFDAAVWSSIIPLSKQSILNGNIPIEFPAFELNELQQEG